MILNKKRKVHLDLKIVRLMDKMLNSCLLMNNLMMSRMINNNDSNGVGNE